MSYDDESVSVGREETLFVPMEKLSKSIDVIRNRNIALAGELLHDMRQAKSDPLRNPRALGILDELKAEGVKYSLSIEKLTKKIHKLDGSIRSRQKHLLERSQTMDSNFTAVHNANLINKRIRSLETHLNRKLIQFNKTMASNQKLRAQIDHHRLERARMDRVYTKMEKELFERSRRIERLARTKQFMVSERKRLQDEMATLVSAADKDQQQFENRVRQLGTEIEREKQRRKRQTVQNRRADLERLHNEEKRLRVQEVKSLWKDVKDQVATELVAETIASYVHVFKELKELTGEPSLNAMIHHFLDQEEDNFSLLQQVNELVKEIDEMEDHCFRIRQDIGRFKGAGEDGALQRKAAQEQMERRLLAANQKSATAEREAARLQELLTLLHTTIGHMFVRIGVAGVESDGGGADVVTTESNVKTHLGIIEQTGMELVQSLNAKDEAFQLGDVLTAGSMKKRSRRGVPSKMTIRAPSVTDVADATAHSKLSAVEEEHPLSFQDLKKSVGRSLPSLTGDGGGMEGAGGGRRGSVNGFNNFGGTPGGGGAGVGFSPTGGGEGGTRKSLKLVVAKNMTYSALTAASNAGSSEVERDMKDAVRGVASGGGGGSKPSASSIASSLFSG